jgi:uncharacterized repeat protein (TIGR01451 family)
LPDHETVGTTFLEVQMKQVGLTVLGLAMALAAGNAVGADTCKTDTTQADFQAGTSNSVDLTTSAGNVLLVRTTSGGGTVDPQAQNTGTAAAGYAFTNTTWTGQTFTPSLSGSLTRVDVSLACNFCAALGGTPPSVVVSVRATSGGLPTGSDLASATLNWTDLSGAQTWYAANFASAPTVTAGSQYAIVIRATGPYIGGSGSTLTHNLLFEDSTSSANVGSDVYGGGALVQSTNGGGAWSIPTYTGSQSDGFFKTYIGGGCSGYCAPGDWTSSAKDSAPATGYATTWSTLSWNSTLPAGTTLRFQAAGSNAAGGPFNFVGPDGTAATYFTTSNASLAPQFNGYQYLKYRAYLSTSNSGSTPTLADATVCYSSVGTADLQITNTDNATSVTPGNTTTYTIVATNNGPADVTGATVTDTFPSSLSSCQWTCTGAGSGTCPGSGTGNISSAVNLPSGGSVTFTATCSLAITATGTLSNTASIAAPSGINDPTAANNSATDSDTITAPNSFAITITDNVDLVRIGDVVNYVIQVLHPGGSGSATPTVTDTLPTQLSGVSWTCSGTNGGVCGPNGSGSGNALSDNPTLPVGGAVTYVYTANVLQSAGSGSMVTNSATLKTTGGNSPSGNTTVSDADMVVLFVNGFDGGAAKLTMRTTSGGGSSSMTAGVDAGLLNHLGAAPVTIAQGRSASGKKLFDLQLAQLGGAFLMRTLTPIDDSVFSDVAPWHAVDLKQRLIGLQWQTASGQGDDGLLYAGSAGRIVPMAANNSTEAVAQLDVTVENDIPWLVLVEP